MSIVLEEQQKESISFIDRPTGCCPLAWSTTVGEARGLLPCVRFVWLLLGLQKGPAKCVLRPNKGPGQTTRCRSAS